LLREESSAPVPGDHPTPRPMAGWGQTGTRPT